MGKYYDSDDPGRVGWGLAWRYGLMVLAVIVACTGLGWVGWYIKVQTSEFKGKGDAQIQINDGKNQIQSQELFQDMYHKIQEYDTNLSAAAAALAADPKNEYRQIEYTGLLQTCTSAVQQYNAEARKISRGKWMSADLPFEIDQTDPRFDCKPTGVNQ